MLDRAANLVRAASRSASGSIAILLGIMLTMLAGFAALGSEVVYAFYVQTRMETAASSAAVGGAVALAGGADTVALKLEATAIAATAGFVAGTAGATVTVNNPPKSGPYAGLAAYVEVLVGEPLTLPISSLFFAGPWQVGARAVAKAGSTGNYCVLELDPGTAGAVTLSAVTLDNGVTMTLNSCGMAVDSTASPALSVYGGATLNAKGVSVVGSDNVYGGGSINPSSGVQTAQPAVANPYSADVVPSYGACQYGTSSNTPWSLQGSQTISAGVYCDGLTTSYGTITMNPGIYYIEGGVFNVQNGVTLTGSGVTIILTGSGSNYATVSIGNGTNVTLSAPTAGATKGLVFFGDPNAPTTNTNTFEGGTNMTLTGAVYFPTESVAYGNGSTTSAATCTQLIAWHMSFVGGVSFNSNCGSAGVSAIGGSQSQLVE